MQAFKEIPFQNYIELKFNTKNLNESAQQEALIKYKRNAQLLAQIFTFDHKKREVFKSQDCITQSQLEQMAKSIKNDEEANHRKIEEVRETSKKYEEISNNCKNIKSKEDLLQMIESLKQNGLYDDSHPYFVNDSPFYMSTTEEDHLQVENAQDLSEEGLSFFEIN